MDDAPLQLFPDDVDAEQALGVAVARAAAAGRRVLVVFGANWCPDCWALDEILAHPLVAPLVHVGFEPVRLGVGHRDRHLATAERLGIDYQAGIPAAVVLDGEGHVVHATRRGELRSARTLSALEFAAMLREWLPPDAD